MLARIFVLILLFYVCGYEHDRGDRGRIDSAVSGTNLLCITYFEVACELLFVLVRHDGDYLGF